MHREENKYAADETSAYWLDGTPYCVACVEGESPCLGEDEIARATQAPGEGRCGCCGESF